MKQSPLEGFKTGIRLKEQGIISGEILAQAPNLAKSEHQLAFNKGIKPP